MDLGDNIEYEIEGNFLILKIDLSKTVGTSSSGKSENIATTRGNKSLEGNFKDIKVGLNIYRPKKS